MKLYIDSLLLCCVMFFLCDLNLFCVCSGLKNNRWWPHVRFRPLEILSLINTFFIYVHHHACYLTATFEDSLKHYFLEFSQIEFLSLTPSVSGVLVWSSTLKERPTWSLMKNSYVWILLMWNPLDDHFSHVNFSWFFCKSHRSLH